MDRFMFVRGCLSSLICSIEPEGGGDGGGGANDKPLTAEGVQGMIAAALKDHGKTINIAVAAHLKRALEGDTFKTSIVELVKGSVGDAVKEALEASKEPPAGGDKGGGEKPGAPAAVSPEIAKRLEQLEKRAAKAEQAAQDAEALRQKEATERAIADAKGKLGEALTTAGVAPKRLKAAVALLFGEEQRLNDEKGALRRDEKGALLFRNDEGEDVPLADGIKGWVKSETGQEFLPPRPVAGSGGNGGKVPAAGTAQPGDLSGLMGIIMSGGTTPS
jgi:hypothetical protein